MSAKLNTAFRIAERTGTAASLIATMRIQARLQSDFAPVSRTTLPHFAISAFT